MHLKGQQTTFNPGTTIPSQQPSHALSLTPIPHATKRNPRPQRKCFDRHRCLVKVFGRLVPKINTMALDLVPGSHCRPTGHALSSAHVGATTQSQWMPHRSFHFFHHLPLHLPPEHSIPSTFSPPCVCVCGLPFPSTTYQALSKLDIHGALSTSSRWDHHHGTLP